MKHFVVLMLALTSLSACVTRIKEVEVEKPVPIYLTIHPERPDLVLKTLNWLYLPEEELLALTPDEFDKHNENNAAIEAYILKLQEGLEYYERSTSGP